MRTLGALAPALIDHRGSWYVIARDPARAKEIPFRVDRIRQATIVGSEYEVPDDFTTEIYRRDEMWQETPGNIVVKVRFSPAAAPRVREESPRRDIQELAGGGVVRSYRIDRERPRWLLTHLGRFGPEAEVLSPPEIRRAMAAFLDDLLRTARPAADHAEPRSAAKRLRGGRTATAAAVVRSQRPLTRRRPQDS